MRDHLLRVAEGVIGGALGTVVIAKGIEAASRLPDPLKPTAPSQNPAAFLARKAARVKPLAPGVASKLAKGLPFAYGSSWGLLFGLLAGRRARSAGQAVAAGAALGALVWLVGYAGWLPATGLLPPIHKQGGGHMATQLGLHIAYGVATALPVYALERARR